MSLSKNQFVAPQMLQQLLKSAVLCTQIPNPLSSQNIPSAIILPFRNSQCYGMGGVVHPNGDPIEGSSLHEKIPVESYPLLPDESITHVDGNAIYLGLLLSQWGHGLTDNIKRLWFLDTPEAKQLIQNGAKIVYVADPIFQPRHPVAQIFEAAGFDISNWLKIDSPTSFSNVIIPDPAIVNSHHSRQWAPQLAQIHRKILNSFPPTPSPYKKIYFSRTRFLQTSKQNEIGEKDLEQVFRKMGFHIAYPEQLSLAQQINLLRNCRVFAATEGSISHNSIWCPQDAEIIILQKSNHVNTWQLALNDMHGQKATYIKAHHTRSRKRKHKKGACYICITHFLEDYFGKRFFHLPKFLRPSWWKHYQNPKSSLRRFGFATPKLNDAR